MSDKEMPISPEPKPKADQDNSIAILECKLSTMEHIESVRSDILWFIYKLINRGAKHDRSKLRSPEVELFARDNYKLQSLEYGTPEYVANLSELSDALGEHYAKNRHHPEHFSNGINGMTLVDVIEMFCDWRASTSRNKKGNLLRSIDTNVGRFHIDEQLKQIFVNTANMIDDSDD
ncbi:hypothetical protein IKG06_04075 [Candidatus Saccharibacteria bacterium]|nr:hypothetical protein [Candidatus Saccharibacteria bacterium]